MSESGDSPLWSPFSPSGVVEPVPAGCLHLKMARLLTFKRSSPAGPSFLHHFALRTGTATRDILGRWHHLRKGSRKSIQLLVYAAARLKTGVHRFSSLHSCTSDVQSYPGRGDAHDLRRHSISGCQDSRNGSLPGCQLVNSKTGNGNSLFVLCISDLRDSIKANVEHGTNI